MDCLALPVAVLRRWGSGSSLGYRQLETEDGVSGRLVTVVVGKERREFLVDPFVLQESPLRVLIDTVKGRKGRVVGPRRDDKETIFVDVDAILFEHVLRLLRNDCSSLFELNVEEIIDSMLRIISKNRRGAK